MKTNRLRYIFLLGSLLPVFLAYAAEQELPSRSNVIALAKKVNDYWIANHLDPGNNEWPRATYFAGNMELYKVSGKRKYLDYAIEWAERNNWAINGGPTTSNADNHTCGQVYIDLYLMDDVKEQAKIEGIKNAIDYRIENNPESTDWWWVDALFMAMPTIMRLGVVCEDTKYFDKLYGLFSNTRDTLLVRSGTSYWPQIYREKYGVGPIVTCTDCGNDFDGLYNSSDGLWWRDWGYQTNVPPKKDPYTNYTKDAPKLSPNGKNIYWSRGNGWAMAALARTLEFLPETIATRQDYIQVYTQMAKALKNCQRSDGFWNMNLADPEHFPAPETSGSAFFTYGLAWGINNGYLDFDTYYPVVAKAWNGLSTVAIQSNGNVRYAQNVGESPIDPSRLTTSSVDFGVGAVLLAASEVSKLAYDDGLPDEEDHEEVLLDRSAWTITTSYEGPVDDNILVGGDLPEYIIDGDIKSAFLFVKPGKSHKGVEVPVDIKPWFIIDTKQMTDMTYLYYRHRDYDNTVASLRASKGSFYGKNSESEEFQPIIENFNIKTSETDVRIDFPEKVSYRYIKFVIEEWDILKGNTIQVSEFYLGNKQEISSNVVNPLVVDKEDDWSVSVFPNQLNIGQPFYVRFDDNSSEDAIISVYTVWGTKLSECKTKDTFVKQMINKPGIYFVEVRNSLKKHTAKIIVN